jgi:hypothetical protein
VLVGLGGGALQSLLASSCFFGLFFGVPFMGFDQMIAELDLHSRLLASLPTAPPADWAPAPLARHSHHRFVHIVSPQLWLCIRARRVRASCGAKCKFVDVCFCVLINTSFGSLNLACSCGAHDDVQGMPVSVSRLTWVLDAVHSYGERCTSLFRRPLSVSCVVTLPTPNSLFHQKP